MKKTSPICTKFDLTQLTTAQLMVKPLTIEYKDKLVSLDVLELEFKDGVVIQFGTERGDDVEQAETDLWMAALEDVDRVLGDSPIPDWLAHCQ
jgi:hypothetical protein